MIKADKEDGEWEAELVSTVVEALSREEEIEDTSELYFLCSPEIAIMITGEDRLSR